MTVTEVERALADEAFDRTDRLLTITSRLGAKRLLLTALSGEEAVSKPFCFDVELLSHDDAIHPEDLVGTPVSLRVSPVAGAARLLHGIIRGFKSSTLNVRGFCLYRAQIVPWLWFLSRSVDCRIVQRKNVPDIVKAVFALHGFTDYEFRLAASYPVLDYCVQYRETALNFVSRLLETAGITYVFQHEEASILCY